jgi:catechol 2,3-dioxygenase-like lactoylglutathione lyase family enzyme
MGKTFDRRAQDVGNIVGLEHVNVRIPDQQIATAFYVVGMGFTRDPYLMVGLENMWINVGQQQFHLPTNTAQVLRGVTGIVVPDLDVLVEQLTAVKEKLAGTAFDFSVDGHHVLVTCPWGNRLRCHAPAPEFGDRTLGVPYVEFPVDPGTAEGIARFYRTVMGAGATVESGVARICVGPSQSLAFRETPGAKPGYDGHHVAVYVSDFSGPHDRLEKLGLISEESNPYQYRFVTIADPDTGKPLFDIEHEVRCVTHPMYLRPLVNRNPAQRQPTYQRGRDAFVPGMA